ncbi:siderophore-interacting protein [Nakamurella sp. YIM 132087]|uniref:Siderophore-interacting protein n=1 Tax=Nakamurella alba TaxID=2665158 RepID=A0A7K1FMJ8_9ACTN|nr:siderophore-interacting protein [Nakamurella alba]MTD15382.1 siderophore-interacting protein [Nakamurella alba]
MSAPARTRPARPAPRKAEVLRREQLSPTMVRVVLGGEGLADFPGSAFTDSYVKLTFGAETDERVVRTYTVRSWDAGTGELAIDFVVHGDTGVAGPWAAAATPGDSLLVAGPGGAYSPDPQLGFHLFLGDESALPAIAASIESLPADARGLALIEVAHHGSELPVQAPAGIEIRWLYTEGRVGEVLVAAARELELPADLDAFVHGEAGFVKLLRTHLRADRKLAKDRLSISGYWRVGATEDLWQSSKPQWNAEADAADRAAGVTD